MSKVIHNPLLAAINELSSTSAEFVIEPLHAGYRRGCADPSQCDKRIDRVSIRWKHSRE